SVQGSADMHPAFMHLEYLQIQLRKMCTTIDLDTVTTGRCIRHYLVADLNADVPWSKIVVHPLQQNIHSLFGADMVTVRAIQVIDGGQGQNMTQTFAQRPQRSTA